MEFRISMCYSKSINIFNDIHRDSIQFVKRKASQATSQNKKHDGEFLGVFDLFDTTAKNWEKN